MFIFHNICIFRRAIKLLNLKWDVNIKFVPSKEELKNCEQKNLKSLSRTEFPKIWLIYYY